MSPKTRKIAGVIASMAVGISLLGAGTYASFSQSATATDKIKVGTMVADITSTASGATFMNAGGGACDHTIANPCTQVTLDTSANPIQSSAANPTGQPLPFKVNNIGGVTFSKVHVVSSDNLASVGSGAFSDLLPNPVADQTNIAPGAAASYTGGIKWTELQTADEGQSVSVTYAVTVTG